MGDVTAVASIPYKLLGDAPDANLLSSDLASHVDRLVFPPYASTAARDAANISPVEGDECYVTGKGRYRYDGTTWWIDTSPLGWQSWTPTWSTSTAAHIPSVGNGTLTAKWIQIYKVVYFNMEQTMGTTTNFNSGTGSDNWTWSLPTAVQGTIISATLITGFSAFRYNGTDAKACPGIVQTVSGGTFRIVSTARTADATVNGGGGVIDAATPGTWTSGGTLYLCGRYFVQ